MLKKVIFYFTLFFIFIIFSGCELSSLFVPEYNFPVPEVEQAIIEMEELINYCETAENNYENYIKCSSTMFLGLLKKEEHYILKAIDRWIRENITYTTDIEKHGYDNNWQTPLETYEDRSGDCEDTAILFAYLANKYYGETSTLYIIDYIETDKSHMYTEHDGYIFNRFSGKYKVSSSYTYDDAIFIAHYIH